MTHFIYLTTNLITNEKYIGKRFDNPVMCPCQFGIL